MNGLKDKSARVLVADPVASTRLMMTSELRALGFANTMAVPSLSEAMPMLIAEPADWLITSLFTEERVNALHMLTLSRQQPDLARMRLSFWVSETEDIFLPRSFALGLMSWHRRPFNKQSFNQGNVALLETAESLGWDEVMLSAHYIRHYYSLRVEPEARLKFENALVTSYPERAELLLPLAEACFECGDDGRARSLLWQVEQRQPELVELARALGDQYLGTSGDRQWEALRPGTCLVIDPDSAARRQAEEVLASCGAVEIFVFEDGESAWEWLKTNGAPDLVIMEWRIPKLSGPAFLQRFRGEKMHLPLVIVNSSLVTKKDQPLLEEMGVGTVLEKPTTRNDYVNCLAWAVGQTRRPTEPAALEGKIRALLASGKVEEAEGLMRVYAKRDDIDDAARRRIEAEFAFALGDFPAARELAMRALQAGGRSVVALNLLAKTLVKLGDHKAAMQVFERADEISPNSIERLCAIAEAQCALGEDDNAHATLNKAEKLDADNQAVINSSVNIALATGDAAAANKLFDKVRPSDSVLAYINNRAVAYSKSGDLAKSIELYNKALVAIPSDRAATRSVVLYNLALAQVQADDVAGSIASLKAALFASDQNLKVKVASLLERSEAAKKAGTKLKLNQRDTAAAINVKAAPSKFAAMQSRVDGQKVVQRSTVCCHKIFVDESSSPLVEALLQNMPRFGKS